MRRIALIALLFLPASAQEKLSETEVLSLAKRYLAGGASELEARHVFNHQQSVEALVEDGKITPAEWARLRDVKLQAIREANRKFLEWRHRQGKAFGVQVNRFEHMGSSGTVGDFKHTSDVDLRPNEVYPGMEADYARFAREAGILDPKEWKINLLGPTGFGSVDQHLRAAANPENYALEGALKFLNHKQWSTNVSDWVDNNGRFQGNRPTKEILPEPPKPTAADAVDYMVEMRRRGGEKARELEAMSDEELATRKGRDRFKELARDLYKYGATRAIGEAEKSLRELNGGKLPPELEELVKEAKALKENPNLLGDNVEEIRAKVKRIVELQRELLDKAFAAQAAEVAEKSKKLGGEVTEKNLNDFVELERLKLRLALDALHGGKEVEELLRKHVGEELWSDIERLKRFAEEEFYRQTGRRPTDQEMLEALRDRVRERIRQKKATAETTEPPLDTRHRLLERGRQDTRRLQPPPVSDTVADGRVNLYGEAARNLNDATTTELRKLGPPDLWFQDVNRVLKRLWDTRSPRYAEALRALCAQLNRDVPTEAMKAWVDNLLGFERVQMLSGLRKYWNSYSPQDQGRILRGRSLAWTLIPAPKGVESLNKMLGLMLLWDLAWAAYEGGWDGFLVATEGAAREIVKWETYGALFSTLAPSLLLKAGQIELASLSMTIAEWIPTYLLLQIATAIVVKGLEKITDTLVWAPQRDKYFKRFYDYHPRSGDDGWGQGFFDAGREGHDLTPQSLFRGNAVRKKGYGSPRDLLAAIARHRDNLIKDGVANVASFGPQGMQLWQSIMDGALADWGMDAARAMQEIRDRMAALLGSVQDGDIVSLVANAREPEKSFAVPSIYVSERQKKMEDQRWEDELTTYLLVGGYPGASGTLKIVQKIRETGESDERTTSVYFSEADQDPKDLVKLVSGMTRMHFDRIGDYTLEIEVFDDRGRSIAKDEKTLGIGVTGEVQLLRLQAALSEDGPAVWEARAGDKVFVRLEDQLRGFEGVETKSLEAWLADGEGRRVPGASGRRDAPKETNPAAVPLTIPEETKPGKYKIVASETLWREHREMEIQFAVTPGKPAYTGFRCVVSPESRRLRGDTVSFGVEFDGKNVPRGTTAQATWTIQRPVKSPRTTQPSSFEVVEGHNRYIRPAPAQIGKEADAGVYGVTATVTIEGETFTASTSFEVSDDTLRLDAFDLTYRLCEGPPTATFAPGDLVWARAHYTLSGPQDAEQIVQATWSLGRGGAPLEEISKSTVPMTPGKHLALHWIPIPKEDRSLGTYTLQVVLQAERQEPVVAATSFEVKRPVEWDEPPFVVGSGPNDTESCDDFRPGDKISLILRFKENVENGRRIRWQIATAGASLGGKNEHDAKIQRMKVHVDAVIPQDMAEGAYTATGRVRSDDDEITVQATFRVSHPAKIASFSVVEREKSNVAKNRFEQGEDFGITLGYSLDHLDENETNTVAVAMFYEGQSKALWSRNWGPYKSQPGDFSVTAGSRWHPQQVPGRYVFVAEVRIGGFTARAEQRVVVEKEPVVEEPPPVVRRDDSPLEWFLDDTVDTEWALGCAKDPDQWVTGSWTIRREVSQDRVRVFNLYYEYNTKKETGRDTWTHTRSTGIPSGLGPGGSFTLTTQSEFGGVSDAAGFQRSTFGWKHGSEDAEYTVNGESPGNFDFGKLDVGSGKERGRIGSASGTWVFTMPKIASENDTLELSWHGAVIFRFKPGRR